MIRVSEIDLRVIGLLLVLLCISLGDKLTETYFPLAFFSPPLARWEAFIFNHRLSFGWSPRSSG